MRVSLSTALVLLCAPCRAQEREAEVPAPFRLEYVGPANCASASQLSEAILRRVPQARLATDQEQAVTFRLEYELEDGVSGQLDMREPSGRTTRRQVRAANCQEASAALTLIAAVLLDPLGSLEPRPKAPPSSPKKKRARPAPLTESAAGRWRFAAEAGVGLEGAVAPRPTFSELVGVNVALEQPGWLEPLFALSIERAPAEDVPVVAGRARFNWTVARLAICPFGYSFVRSLTLRACGLFDGGVLRADGESADGTHTVNAPWSALGGALRLDLATLRVLVLSLQSGAISPLARGHFDFLPRPANTAFTVPAVGAVAQFALGLRF